MSKQGVAEVGQEGESVLSHFKAVMMLILMGLRITVETHEACT